MSKANNLAESAIREPRAKRLAAASTLFEAGALSDEISEDSFVLRLNAIVARRFLDAEKNTPTDLTNAITTTGRLNRYAELVAFGRWLLLEGHPGMAKQGGKQPNLRVIAKCVAVAMYELRVRPKLREHAFALAGRKSRTREITKRDLAERWHKLLGEKKEPSFFDARLRSLKRILSAYLEHLESGDFVGDGKQIKKSPEIEEVLKAITGKSTAQPGTKASAVTKTPAPVPADLSPFEIELRYSSPAQEEEYRNRARVSLPPSRLRYLPTATSSTSTSGAVRADRKDKVVLVPDMAMRDNYKVEALIDRMVVLINTTTQTDYSAIKKKIAKSTGTSIYVQDLTISQGAKDWGAPLPVPSPLRKTGYHFAVMIQDPTPDKLSAMLKVVHDGPGIDGAVTAHLVEISVDFYPRATGSLEESILRREQMVGMLHRHHWCRNELFLDTTLTLPRDIDARQIYQDPAPRNHNGSKTRFLFAHVKPDSLSADYRIDIPEMRQRILTSRGGEDIHLNSTVLKGAKNACYQVSIQHKIANRRNRDKSTKDVLPDHERRARIEVTISGSNNLKDRGIATIDDLGSVSFRKLTKPFLSFALGTTEPWQHLLEDAQAQMRKRGVYGIELRNRARALEEREQLRRSGEKLPRKNDREGHGLQSWKEMNDVVGKSLDELQRRWAGFSWK